MGDWLGGLGLRLVAAIVCIIAVIWLALWYFIPAPPKSITIAAGIKGGAFEQSPTATRSGWRVTALNSTSA
jgi:hypothetical protein